MINKKCNIDRSSAMLMERRTNTKNMEILINVSIFMFFELVLTLSVGIVEE